MSASIRHVTPVSPKTAEGPAADVYRQAEAELGVIGPPIVMLSPAPELLAPMWSLLRESLLVGGPEERTGKEVVATTIAVKNSCRFCTDAHTMMLHAVGEHDLAEAVREGRPPREYADLAEWAAAPSLDGPFDAEAAPRFIGTALVFEFITRLVKVMAANASPHPVTTTKLGRSVASRQVREAVAARLEPGLSLPLLDSEWLREHRPDLDLSVPAWADGSPVGRAFAQLRATSDLGMEPLGEAAAAGAERTIERSVNWWGTNLVTGPLEIDGIDGLSGRWALGARLAASAALDPQAVTDAEVISWRAGSLSDRAVVSMFAFGVFHAVGQIESSLNEIGSVNA